VREIDDDSLQILTGSRSGDAVEVYVWYDGQLALEEPLKVAAWKASWDDTRQIKGTFAVDVVDPSGALSPWQPDDPLGVGGSVLQVLYNVGGGGQVNLGWFRITQAQPEDTWQLRLIPHRGYREPDSGLPDDMELINVPMGSIVPLDCEDLAVNIKNDRLVAPESPRTATVLSELGRLLEDIVPLNVMDGVADEAISKSVVFERERLDAVEDLVGRLDAGWRFNGNGELELYPLADRTSRWQLAGGEQGVLISAKRKQTLDGLENMFVSDGTRKAKNAKGEEVDLPVRGIATIAYGPLRPDGPHGRFVTFRSSPLITSQTMADKDAVTFRDNAVRSRTIDLEVECLPNPALETGDYVTVVQPVVDGGRVPLVGRVKTMELSGGNGTVGAMKLTVTCDAAMVETVLGNGSGRG